MSTDSRLDQLLDFLRSKPDKRASNDDIVTSLKLWPTKEEFFKWRETYLEAGKLSKAPGRGGGTAIAEAPSGPTRTPRLSARASQLLSMIPVDGSSIGNTYLRSRLGLSADEYWEIREELIGAGLIQIGRGRGGSVSRTGKGLEAGGEESRIGLVEEERNLYEPLRTWLEENWGKEIEQTSIFHHVKVTASPEGRRRASGKWSRPDVTFVQVNRFDLLPGSEVEVTSFEVKKHEDAQDLVSVFEAAAHSRWAHYSYLVAEVTHPEEAFDERLRSECSRFGVGLMTIFKTQQGYECREDIEPKRNNPAPEDLDNHLKQFFSDDPSEKKFRSAIGR